MFSGDFRVFSGVIKVTTGIAGLWLSDCSPASRQRELGFGRRETGSLYPTDELAVATIFEVCARGALRSDTW